MVLPQQPLPLRQDATFFKRAKRVSTPHFLVYWEKLSDSGENSPTLVSQISIVVPKHQLKTSVKRHRVKRQFRGAWQRLSKHMFSPTRLVFVVNKSALYLTKIELDELITSQFQKINSLQGAR